jgi:outer membrane receptor for ferric coprogen and ferric-rhodotorulic acid
MLHLNILKTITYIFENNFQSSLNAISVIMILICIISWGLLMSKSARAMFKHSTAVVGGQSWSVIALAISAALVSPQLLAVEEASVERLEISGSRAQGYLVDQNSSATKLDLSLKDTPQAISILSAEQLQDFALSNINQALDQATGVNVERIETDRTYYNARGFDITNFQVDGLGLPFTGGGIEGDIDTAIFERVEIIRGANGLMSGVGNPSATVNMVRKRAGADTAAKIRASYGSFANTRLEGDVQGALTDGLNLRAVLVKEDKDSYLDRYNHDKTVGYLVASAALGDNTLFTFGHSAQDSQGSGGMWGALSLYYGDGSPIAYHRSASTSANWSYWQVQDNRSFVELSHQFNDDWKLISSYQLLHNEQAGDLFYVYISAEHGIDPITGLGTTGYGSFYSKTEKTQLADLYLQGKFSLAGRQHELVTGANIADRHYTDLSLYDYSTGLGFPLMPALIGWQGNTPLPSFNDGAAGSVVDADQQALYAVVRWELLDSLKLITGARWIDARVAGTSYGVDQQTAEDGLVPYVGAVWELTPQINLYASHTAIFQPQKERDDNRRLLPAVDGKATELGLKASLFNDQALLSVAAFEIEQQNLAVFVKDVADPTLGLYKVYKAAQGIQSKGLELELSGSLTEQLQLSGSVTTIDIDGDDLVKGYTPKQVAKLAAVYQLSALPGARVGLNYRWQSDISRKQGVVTSAYANAGQDIITRQQAYGLLGLMASYDFDAQWQLQVNANNLTNENYLNSLYWAQAYYGAPANYSLSVSYQF